MIKQFEDLPVWQDARKLTKRVYKIASNTNFDKDYRLRSQIQASSVSVMSNIAEGFENQTKKQFIRYLYIARGSSGELRSQLYVAFDVNYIEKNVLDDLKNQATSISRQCTGLINYLEQYEPPSDIVKEPSQNDFFEMITQYFEQN